MWSFKAWLTEDLDALADKVFSQRDKNAKLKPSVILQALGIKSNQPLKSINKGSIATIYSHPEDGTKVIKVTADAQDARNLLKAQRLNSPNIPKVYQSAKVGPKATALVIDFVQGHHMPYNSSALLSLINGDNWDEAQQAVRGILRPDHTRTQTLDKFDLNTDEERQKLSQLFMTLARLEKLGIDIYDFTDNILDNGQHYVIIDMGM